MKRIAGVVFPLVFSVSAIGCIPQSDTESSASIGILITFVGDFLRSVLAAWLF